MRISDWSSDVCSSDLGRVLAFSGRYAQLPKSAPQYTTIHLLHGADDAVMAVSHAQAAQARLDALHGDATLDAASRVGYVLPPALVRRVLGRRRACVPLLRWGAGAARPQAAAPTGH